MPEQLIKRFEEEICSNCCTTNCKKGIVVFTETISMEDEIKNIVCAKCVDYKKKNKQIAKE